LLIRETSLFCGAFARLFDCWKGNAPLRPALTSGPQRGIRFKRSNRKKLLLSGISRDRSALSGGKLLLKGGAQTIYIRIDLIVEGLDSIQRQDPYLSAEYVTQWREKYRKPVVLDEICYEGNLQFGWGNISGKELLSGNTYQAGEKVKLPAKGVFILRLQE